MIVHPSVRLLACSKDKCSKGGGLRSRTESRGRAESAFRGFPGSNPEIRSHAGEIPYLIEEEQLRMTLDPVAHVKQVLHVVGERRVGFRRQCQGVVAEVRAERGERVLPTIKGLFQRLESCQQERR